MKRGHVASAFDSEVHCRVALQYAHFMHDDPMEQEYDALDEPTANSCMQVLELYEYVPQVLQSRAADKHRFSAEQ